LPITMLAASTSFDRFIANTAHQQVAAIPVRWNADGAAEVLLVTTRGGGRWMAPKGWPITGAPNPHCAEREAYEEAGVLGRVERCSLGEFEYARKSRKRATIVRATAYLLRVERVLSEWPERGQRKRVWFPLETAVRLVANDELGALIRAAAALGPAAEVLSLPSVHGMLN
jgi:8-oxo-dGTP pyrophosphatase MutT (NUDIX family)